MALPVLKARQTVMPGRNHVCCYRARPILKVQIQKAYITFGNRVIKAFLSKSVVGPVEASSLSHEPSSRRAGERERGVMGLFYEALNSIPDSG